ncbi:helicase-related protein [Streptomyces sp. GLT-R25]
MDITDTQLQAAQLLGVEGRSDEVRGARLAALQTALVKASAEEDFRRTLVFHHLVKEAEAFAVGLPDVAAQLHADDSELYPGAVWADWLCGDHPPAHRRRVLDEFASRTDTARRFLGSAKVLGEGVDTKNCDSVYFADVRGSMSRPGPGRRPRPAHPTQRGQGRLPRRTGTARARGNHGQHAHQQGIRRARQAPGSPQGARHPHRGSTGRATSLQPLQGRPEP